MSLWWFWRAVSPSFHTYLLSSSICVWRNLLFQTIGRSHLWFLYLRLLVRNLWLRTTVLLVFFLWLVKSFKKLVNNRLVNNLEKCALLSNFHYGFRSSQSFADLLRITVRITVRILLVSVRITYTFNRSGATRAVPLDMTKVFDRIWHADLLHKFKSYGVSGQVFDLIPSFLSSRRLQPVLDGKSSQEYPANSGVPLGSIYDLPDDVIYNIAIYADDTTLCCKCDHELYPLLKPLPRKLEPWSVLWCFFLRKLLFISINLQYSLAWNTVIISGMVFLVTTSLC